MSNSPSLSKSPKCIKYGDVYQEMKKSLTKRSESTHPPNKRVRAILRKLTKSELEDIILTFEPRKPHSIHKIEIMCTKDQLIHKILELSNFYF